MYLLYLPSFTEHAAAAAAKLLQSCPTLCDSVDGGPRGSPVPGILQARTLEWALQNTMLMKFIYVGCISSLLHFDFGYCVYPS